MNSSQLALLLAKDMRKRSETQLQRYMRLGAAPPVLDIIRCGGGPGMGAQCERLFRDHWPSLKVRETKKASDVPTTGYDHRVQCPVSETWKLLEQKTSGMWSDDPTDFHWQHLEVNHPWNGLLLVGITLDGMKAWGMTRADFLACVADGRATNQGNKEKNSSEGVWMMYRNVHTCLVPLLSEDDLLAFCSTL
jgi:hypothetical protein